ncbi:MAG: Gx transporter family protein [Coriobacteriia bacterium]|nr:Gx transporter family protein [Coriobacteriia bacterium]
MSLLSAVALVLSYLETMIPLPVALPGVKLGLANVAVAVALFSLDTRSAAAVAAVKVFASGLLFGSPMMLAYSFGGTALAFMGMAAMSAVPGMGLVPVSMVAAILHNAGQLAVAALVLGTPSVFVNLPVLAVAACVTGGITGAVGEAALASLEGAGGEKGRPVVDCAPLGSIAPGELVVFVGANGSGKTSCALQLAGLAAGGGVGDGAVAGAPDGPAAGRRVGVSFQDPDSQIVAPVVRDDVAFGPENRGTPRERMVQVVNEALVEAGILELSGRDVDSLSGGQKQRVAVAGLLALAPGLVVFDEATAMLDPRAREGFARMVGRLREGGVAVVQITQIMDEALAADRVAVFAGGRIVRVGAPGEVLRDAALLAECGLEQPSVYRLAGAVAGVGAEVGGAGAAEAAPAAGAPAGATEAAPAGAPLSIDDLEEAICRWYAEA